MKGQVRPVHRLDPEKCYISHPDAAPAVDLPRRAHSCFKFRGKALRTTPTDAAQQKASLFDHLVGDGGHPRWDLDAERSSRLKVDDELEFGRLQHCGLGPLEDAAGIDADLTEHIREVGSVTHQPAGCDKITNRISRRNAVVCRQDGMVR
jgi:hypothetical protein